jgi:hypothetical protein
VSTIFEHQGPGASTSWSGCPTTGGAQRLHDLVQAPALPAPLPTPAQVRAWATAQGMAVSPRGRVPASVVAAFRAAQG